MRVLHFVTPGVFPMPGGLEQSVLRVARNLTEPGISEAVIYTRRQPDNFLFAHPAHEKLEVIHLGSEKGFLMEPLGVAERPTESVPGVWQSESLRIDYLLLVEAIKATIDKRPGATHVLISFYASVDGFLAQQVAFSIGIPHIASVQGTDFSRDFRSPYHIQALRFVIENARLTVTNNQEQAAMLGAAFPSARAIRTIHNALETKTPERNRMPTHQPSRELQTNGRWLLAADCGFSFKKATHVLLRAVAEICCQGQAVHLTLVGGDAAREKQYWEEYRLKYTAEYPGVFSFPGPRTSDEVDDLLLASDLYVSASLAEGCSLSHARALIHGIPMVATRTGALPELCLKASHVRLVPPADISALANAIVKTIAELRTQTLQIDAVQVEEWRQHFSPDRERREWQAAVAEVLGDDPL